MINLEGELFMNFFSKFVYKVTQDKIDELNKHPERNKDTGPGMDTKNIVFYLILILIVILTILHQFDLLPIMHFPLFH